MIHLSRVNVFFLAACSELIWHWRLSLNCCRQRPPARPCAMNSMKHYNFTGNFRDYKTMLFVSSRPLVIKAYDNDTGLNSHLDYDIVEAIPRRYFHIDSTTGAIKTVIQLDHEDVPYFTFHVKVSKPMLNRMD